MHSRTSSGDNGSSAFKQARRHHVSAAADEAHDEDEDEPEDPNEKEEAEEAEADEDDEDDEDGCGHRWYGSITRCLRVHSSITGLLPP